jgi:hypothetical protein
MVFRLLLAGLVLTMGSLTPKAHGYEPVKESVKQVDIEQFWRDYGSALKAYYQRLAEMNKWEAIHGTTFSPLRNSALQVPGQPQVPCNH